MIFKSCQMIILIHIISSKSVKFEKAAIAQWIRLRFLSCGPGFESQAHHTYKPFSFIVYCTIFAVLRKGRK